MKKNFVASMLGILTIVNAYGAYDAERSINRRVDALYRCDGVDSLNNDQAKARFDWAKACGFIDDDDLKYAVKKATTKDKEALAHGRLYYPTFVYTDDLSYPTFSAGVPTVDNCANHDPRPFKQLTWCISSCYTPFQKILFSDGERGIKSAKEKNFQGVVVLDEKSTIDNLLLKKSSVALYVEDVKESLQDVVTITTESSKSIQVTLNHPLLDGKGILREAATFKIGDELVSGQGKSEKIVKVLNQKYFGKVYNLEPAEEASVSNLMIAQGFLSGSIKYQNEWLDRLNRMTMRRNLAVH